MNETDPIGAQAMAADGALLLDVREDDEWAAGHAPGAQHMALSVLDVSALPTGVPIAVICKAGGRSGKAQTAMVAAGLDATNVAGGMLAWSGMGLPVVTDGDGAGTVI